MCTFFIHLLPMPTNPIGPETRNMSINVPHGLHADISELAQESGMKLSEYLRALLRRAVETRTVFEIKARDQESRSASALASSSPSASTKAGQRGGRAK